MTKKMALKCNYLIKHYTFQHTIHKVNYEIIILKSMETWVFNQTFALITRLGILLNFGDI